MIHRERFFEKAAELKMYMDRHGSHAWTVPIHMVMVWSDERIYIVPNSVDALNAPAMASYVSFGQKNELDTAFATYQLMNSGETHG